MTKDEKLLLLDAKINIDDNALYRQADIEKLKDILKKMIWNLKLLKTIWFTLNWMEK